MKVLYIHQHFGTPAGSTGTRSYEFARALISQGHKVTVVCGQYSASGLTLPYDERRRCAEGTVDGIHVIVFPLAYSNYAGLMGRALIFLRFAFRCIALALTLDFDLLFATSTPLTTAVPGLAMKLAGRDLPMIFEVRDLWPELPRALGLRNPLILLGMSALEWLAYSFSDAGVGLSGGIVEGMKRRASGLPVAMIPNGCDLELFVPRRRDGLELCGVEPADFVAVFTGVHGVANGLDALLAAAAELKSGGHHQIKLVLIGDGKEKPRLMREAKQRELDNCIFLPPMKKTALAGVTGSCDCGLMILANIPAFYRGTSPNKFFDYLAAGIPIVNNYPGWLAELIRDHDCGVVVPPDNPAELAAALVALSEDRQRRAAMGKNARRLAEASFDRKDLARQFVRLLERTRSDWNQAVI